MEKEKILVIDDEPDMLRGCQKFLETAGYAVVVAESGETGLALFKTETPDLVIVDLKMPGIDGMAVLQRIMARDQEAVVIVFTGYGTIASAVEAIRTGAFYFIQKPFDPEEFLIVIDRALKLRRARVENRTLKQLYEKACDCLTKDFEVLFTFYDFPAKHWIHLRTTNPIESTFATVRHRTRQTKGCGSVKATMAMVYKLAIEAEKTGVRLRGYRLIPLVIDGVEFVDGEREIAA